MWCRKNFYSVFQSNYLLNFTVKYLDITIQPKTMKLESLKIGRNAISLLKIYKQRIYFSSYCTFT